MMFFHQVFAPQLEVPVLFAVRTYLKKIQEERMPLLGVHDVYLGKHVAKESLGHTRCERHP